MCCLIDQIVPGRRGAERAGGERRGALPERPLAALIALRRRQRDRGNSKAPPIS